MVTLFYFIVFAASVILNANFMLRNRRIDPLYVIFGLLIIINSFGRWLISISDTVEQADWANKLTYIGACYTPLVLAVVLAKLCDIKLPKLVFIPMLTYATVVLGFIMTIGHSKIYYKSYSLVKGNGHNYLVKEYGPAHKLYTILVVLSVLLIISLIIYAIIHRNELPFKTVAMIGGLCVLIFVTYVITRLLNSKIEWLSVFYLATVLMINRRFEQMNMYDMSSNIARSVERMKDYAFIAFDNAGNYINANKLSKTCFPEIKNWKTECRVEPSDSLAYKEMILRLENWKKGVQDKEFIKINDEYYGFFVRDIMFKNKKVGDLVELVNKTAEHRYTAQVEEFNSRLTDEVAAKTSHISAIKDKMVIGMAAMVESRDNSTGGHIQRTSDVIRIFSEKLSEHAEEIGIDKEFLDMVVRAAPMHDLGKIAVDDAILRKQGKFTPEEYNEMKKHSAEGAKTVRNIQQGIEVEEFVQLAENVAHYHHEKWNGKGYPCGLSGEQIPIEARIMALADVFDALVSKRCYKEAFDYDTAFDIIKNDLGSHFDPVVGKLFLECRPKLVSMYDVIRAEEKITV